MAHDDAPGDEQPLWRSPAGIVLLGFLIIAGFYLIAEHRAHLFGWLPWLLLLACPLLHFFMHGRHGGHRHKNSETAQHDHPHKEI